MARKLAKKVAIPLTWQDDPLGQNFESADIKTSDGAHVTLVRYSPGSEAPGSEALVSGAPHPVEAAVAPAPVAVLYVHGFSDYFFHPHVAEAFAKAGYAFYAVDLRGYGRSMDAHVANGGDPNMVDEIALHALDLDAAAKTLRELGHQEIVVLAHSMGGLVSAMWAANRPNQLKALILNAPWFDLNENWLLRGPSTAAIGALSKVAPKAVVGGLKPHYGKALHSSTGGQWDYNTTWKPHSGFPVQAAWLSSIRRAQARLNAGLNIKVPVLVLSSTRSGSAKVWHPRLTSTDSVLNVEHIAKGAAQLGRDVTFVQIADGAHDLALSATAQARDDYLAATIGWLQQHVPA